MVLLYLLFIHTLTHTHAHSPGGTVKARVGTAASTGEEKVVI